VVPVADVGREELPETFRGLRLRQEQRRRPGGDGRQIAGSFISKFDWGASRYWRLVSDVVHLAAGLPFHSFEPQNQK
jgi:hypothetical protein